MKLSCRTRAHVEQEIRCENLETLHYYAKHYFYADPVHPLQEVLADPALDLRRLDQDLRTMTDIVFLNDEVDSLLREALAGRPGPVRFVASRGFEYDLKGLASHSELPVPPPGLA